jgi:NAD(P)H-dependent flavin oxidoreductase YrpB (nitropropane dioxygenase family)
MEIPGRGVIVPPIVNRYTRLVGIDHPIVQEGLGPFRTPRLATAVSNAGGLGTVSMPGMPEDLEAGAQTFREHIEECAALTDRPFAVNIPVLLTGGARDGRGLAAALAMGADGVAMGTRFILSHDNSDWHPAYLQALLDAREGDDVAFDGVYGPCRGLRNAASEELLASSHLGGTDPVELTRWKIESMQRAQTDGDVTNGLVLAGQVASAIGDIISVAEFVPNMAEEAAAILRSLCGLLGDGPAEKPRTSCS